MQIGRVSFNDNIVNLMSFDTFKISFENSPIQTTIENAWLTLGGTLPPEAQAKTQSETQITEQPKKTKKSKK